MDSIVLDIWPGNNSIVFEKAALYKVGKLWESVLASAAIGGFLALKLCLISLLLMLTAFIGHFIIASL